MICLACLLLACELIGTWKSMSWLGHGSFFGPHTSNRAHTLAHIQLICCACHSLQFSPYILNKEKNIIVSHYKQLNIDNNLLHPLLHYPGWHYALTHTRRPSSCWTVVQTIQIKQIESFHLTATTTAPPPYIGFQQKKTKKNCWPAQALFVSKSQRARAMLFFLPSMGACAYKLFAALFSRHRRLCGAIQKKKKKMLHTHPYREQNCTNIYNTKRYDDDDGGGGYAATYIHLLPISY